MDLRSMYKEKDQRDWSQDTHVGWEDAFTALGMAPDFDFSLEALDLRYRKIQQKIHPDQHQHSLTRTACDVLAAKVNAAYQVLQDPLQRAACLLKRMGAWPVPDDPEIVTQMFDLRMRKEMGEMSVEEWREMTQQAWEDFSSAWRARLVCQAQKSYLKCIFLNRMGGL